MWFIRFVQEGGVFMYPTLMVMLVGIGIAIERFMFLSRAKSTNKALWEEVFPLIKKGDLPKVLAQVKDSDAEIGRILEYGLSRNQTSKRVEDVETAMEEALMEVLPQLEARTHYLSSFANIATLIGLLGTVHGMIMAFAAVANADPAQKGDMLSASIAVAMNNTALGLGAAIPLLLASSFLQARTGEIVESLEMTSVKLLNVLRQINSSAK